MCTARIRWRVVCGFGVTMLTFLPTIALLKERLDVLELDGGVDYRRRTLEQLSRDHTPLGPETETALMEAFTRMAESAEDTAPLKIEGRTIPYRHLAGGVVWFDFASICGWGRSQLDYLELAKEFHTVIVANVPRFAPDQADEARRFTLLVDVLYDNRVKLVISADAPPEQLLISDGAQTNAQMRALIFEFDRTASRLIEMQSREYLAQPVHR